MKKIAIGIDISKNVLDVAVMDAGSRETLKVLQIKNSDRGISKFIKSAVKKFTKDGCVFCFEHTGNYGLLLSCLLEKYNCDYAAVPAIEIKRSIGLRRGKSDEVDAQRIAEYASSNSHRLRYSKLPSAKLLKIKHLLTYRAFLVKQKVSQKNFYKSVEVTNQSIELENHLDVLREKISQTKQEIKEVDQQISTVISEDSELSKTYKKIQTVRGVGPVIAAYVMLHTQNFQLFDSARKFNSYCGLAPFGYSSGTSIQRSPRTSHFRNKTLKKLLFNGAYTASRYDPQIKKYYHRKLNEGKNKTVVINNIACKLVARIFAVAHREKPYVMLAN